MGILDKTSKAILVEGMRNSLCNVLQESTQMSAKDATQRQKFVREQATYEQLLNITMNPNRDTNYLPDYVLEGAVAVLHRACLTGRKYIGVNAITEGALKLQKETGAVITESMLDAALNSVQKGQGLKVIASVLQESAKYKKALQATKKPVQESKKIINKNVISKKPVVQEAKKVAKKKCKKCGKASCKCK